MPLLTVTGGPIAPAGEALAAASLTVRYFSPYADGVNVYPTEYQAELDGTSGGWKPLGSADGTPFTVPGAADGSPMPPECVLVERQEYTSGGDVTFRYGPLRIYQTSAGEWIYGTPGAGIEFVVDADLPAPGALLTSQLGVAGGVASLDGSGLVDQALAAASWRTLPNGTAGAPALAFGSDQDTGLFRQAANVLGLVVGGVERVRVQGSAPHLQVNDGSLRTVWHAGNVQLIDGGAFGLALRFPNGIQVVWARFSLGARNALGAGTYADPWRTNTVTWTFPAAFSAAPRLLCSPDSGAGTALLRAMAITAGAVSASAATNVQGVALTSAAGADVVFANALAIGTWV